MNSKHRPDRQWYARMIRDTLDDDFVIGPAFEAKAKEAATAEQPLTVAFGLLVRFFRRAKRLSVEELAEKLSVEAEELQHIERDPEFRARPRTILKVANFFDLPVGEVMKLAGATVSNDESFYTKALKFAAHSDDMAALTREEQEALKSFVRYLRDKE
jgi:transcriptional regulator with XRE-family HTH domain